MIRFLLLSTLMLSKVVAQAPGVPIFDQSEAALVADEEAIGKQAELLLEKGLGINSKTIAEVLKSPTAKPVALIEPLDQRLKPIEIAEKVANSVYRVGWVYLCKNCDNWHMSFGGGYAVSKDGMIVTCAHVLEYEELSMRKGLLVVVDQAGKVFPVTAVHRYHEKMDAALVSISAETVPLALNDQVRPGDAAYCLSRPLDQGKYFTAGIVNRFYWDSSSRGDDDKSFKSLVHLKLNVSTRWAPGSSGSPVLDCFGNVIGHVALIDPMSDEEDGPALITLHSAIPARSVSALLKRQ